MVLAYHVVFGTYGFWLPNDPRGSYSNFVYSWELFRYGPATKTNSRRSVAGNAHDRELRLAAKQALKYPAVVFNGLQAKAVGEGFGESARRGNVTVLACAILPDHVHLVIGRHSSKIEWIYNCFKGSATRELRAQKLHPLEEFVFADGTVPCCWGRKGWKAYLDCEEDILRAIRYVEQNPIKEGKRRQRWSFVSPYCAV